MKKIEISLKEIAVSVLNNWLFIVLSMCVFAFALGIGSYLLSPRGESLDVLQQEYQANVAAVTLKSQKIIDEQIAKKSELERNINTLQNASANESKKIVERTVEIMYNEDLVNIYTVSKTYMDYYNKIPLNVVFKDQFQGTYSDDFLKKIISISFETVKGLPKIMKLQAMGTESIDPNKALNILFDFFVDRNSELAEEAGIHTLQVTQSETYDLISTEVMYEERVNELKSVLDNVNTAIENAEADIQAAVAAQPVIPNTIMNNALLGCLIGLIIGVIFVGLRYFYSIPLVVPEQLSQQLGIRYLGGYREKKFGSHLSNALAGYFLLFDDRQTTVNYVSANIRQVVESGDTILFTGSLSQALAQKFADELVKDKIWNDITVITAPNVNTSVEALESLTQANKVVLVERLNESKLKNVLHVTDRITISDKEIIGYVLF